MGASSSRIQGLLCWGKQRGLQGKGSYRTTGWALGSIRGKQGPVMMAAPRVVQHAHTLLDHFDGGGPPTEVHRRLWWW